MNNHNDYMNFLDNLYDGCFSITNKKKKKDLRLSLKVNIYMLIKKL